MTVLARPNHPLRLAGVFAASLLAFGVIAAAAAAVLFIVDRETDGSVSSQVAVDANVELPAGMVLVRQVADAEAWNAELGFEPIEPDSLPSGMVGPTYHVQQPDAAGRIAGHLRYTAEEGRLLIVLVEQRGTLAVGRPMRTGETPTTREHIESFGCGNVVITAQLFFSLDGPAAPTATESLATSEALVANLREQCG